AGGGHRHRRWHGPGPQRPCRPDYPRHERDAAPRRGAGRAPGNADWPVRPRRPGAHLHRRPLAQPSSRPRTGQGRGDRRGSAPDRPGGGKRARRRRGGPAGRSACAGSADQRRRARRAARRSHPGRRAQSADGARAEAGIPARLVRQRLSDNRRRSGFSRDQVLQVASEAAPTHDPPAKLGVLVVATGCMRMQQPDGKQHATPPGGRDERLPPTWQRLLDLPKAPGGDEPVVLGFFLEVMPEEGAAWAHLEVAPVLLAVAEHGRYARPVPLDSRHLVQAPLPPHEQRLAAAVLGLPQTQRKGRSYARLGGHVGDSLLIELLDTAPCFLGGLAGLRLSRGKAHPLNWHWQLETDGSQRLLPNLPHSQRLLRIDGLWYLDAEHTTLGHLEAAPEETAW